MGLEILSDPTVRKLTKCFLFLSVAVPLLFAFLVGDPLAVFYLTPVMVDNWHYRNLVQDPHRGNDPNYWAKEMKLSFIAPSTTNLSPAEVTEEAKYPGFPILQKNYSNPASPEKVWELMLNSNLIKDVDLAKMAKGHIDHLSLNCKRDWNHTSCSLLEAMDLMENTDDNLYIGFQQPFTDEDMAKILGYKELSDFIHLPRYWGHSFFLHRLYHKALTAGVHCAPIDSVAFQVQGKKTWLLWEPYHFARNVPFLAFEGFFTKEQTDDDLMDKLGSAYVVETEPGDVLHFGSGWCHSVLSEEGDSVLFTLRYMPLWKNFFRLPYAFSLTKAARTMIRGKDPRARECTALYGPMCDYFTEGGAMECGRSNRFTQLVEHLKDRMADASLYANSAW